MNDPKNNTENAGKGSGAKNTAQKTAQKTGRVEPSFNSREPQASVGATKTSPKIMPQFAKANAGTFSSASGRGSLSVKRAILEKQIYQAVEDILNPLDSADSSVDSSVDSVRTNKDIPIKDLTDMIRRLVKEIIIKEVKAGRLQLVKQDEAARAQDSKNP